MSQDNKLCRKSGGHPTTQSEEEEEEREEKRRSERPGESEVTVFITAPDPLHCSGRAEPGLSTGG